MNQFPRYPKTLSTGIHNIVIALSQTEAAKLFDKDTRSGIGSEAEKMKFSNVVNGLVVKFLRLEYDEEKEREMLVMERLYPIDFRAFELEKRELWMDVFEDEIKQLHQAGFAHRDIKNLQMPEEGGMAFDNIFLTFNGLRLIDVGISALRSQVGENLFKHYIVQELKEIALFKEFFLTR